MSSHAAETREIDPTTLEPREAYRIFASCVVPRPIAWVSTLGRDGTRNLAPFSFFNAVGGVPPTVMFSVSARSGEPKDTLRNARETGEFVVHIVDESLAEKMNRTSGEWPYDVDEFERAGLTPAPASVVRPARIAEAALAMEGKVTQIVPVEGTQYTMIVGRIVRYHIRADLLRESGLVDAARLRPVARLGGEEYVTAGEVFEMLRPVV
jgi:flavin reductase (DIM6/NTAB) family NADH-FMN oxidoreductase RutF